MFRVTLMFLLLTRVNTEVKSVQKSIFVSRKSRSNSAPIETGYVFSKVNNNPGELAMFANDVPDYNSLGLTFNNDISMGSGHTGAPLPISHSTMVDVLPMVMPYTEAYQSSSYPDYSKAKAESKFNSHYLPSKMESDAMYDRLKSLMHYKEPDGETVSAYDSMHSYHIDDDDVRTSSRSPYDNWPFFYHSPYEYEAIRMGSDIEKAKDKRYISDSKHVIPVHEHVDDIPHYYSPQPLTTSRYDRDVIAENPVYGDQAFFSFVLNDYFANSIDDDPLVFKGLWGKEFDHEPSSDDYFKRNRHLGSHDDYNTDNEDRSRRKLTHNSDSSKYAAGESSTEKGYKNKHEFDNYAKGDEHKENNKAAYEASGHNSGGFKNFVDTFANNFGGEEHMKNSKYVLKHNQDKGENRKGFRRVYHKDEYQEDNEFFDNKNSSAKGEEMGGSAIHNGGSEAFLKSHASAVLGNRANAFSNAGDVSNNRFESNQKGQNHSQGADSEFNRYRDVAKKAALSNSADYVDRF